MVKDTNDDVKVVGRTMGDVTGEIRDKLRRWLDNDNCRIGIDTLGDDEITVHIYRQVGGCGCLFSADRMFSVRQLEHSVIDIVEEWIQGIISNPAKCPRHGDEMGWKDK